jgi:hypothetical protein
MAEDLDKKIDDIQSYPILTEEVSFAQAPRSGTPPAPGTAALGQIVESALRDILAWRPKASDPKGFVAALNQAFTLKQVQGYTEWTWMPRSYAVQHDMGAVTGAQASIYARAQAALDQSLPLLEGLFPLRADSDAQDSDAVRAIVRSGLTELVYELGQVGGPRIDRVNELFESLLGIGINDTNPAERDAEKVRGLLGKVREEFGLERAQVNTIEEEQNLTNFVILVDHVSALRRTWRNQKHFFDHKGSDVFLGTQLVLSSRDLAVVAESVQEVYYAMDSVFLGPAERQTTFVELTPDGEPKTTLSIAEILGWVERFASEEAPRVIREGGKDGAISLQRTLKRLQSLVLALSKKSLENSGNPTPGFHTPRVSRSLSSLATQLKEASNNLDKIRRQDDPSITSFDPTHAARGQTIRLTIDGANFQNSATAWLRLIPDPGVTIKAYPIITADPVTVVSATQISAFFDLTAKEAEPGSKWKLFVRNPDGGTDHKPTFFIDDTDEPFGSPPPAPQVETVSPVFGDPRKPVPVTVRGEGFQPGARVEVDGDAHGITVTSGYRSEQEMSAFFVIADDAPTGRPVDVIVINPDGKQGRKTGAFTVREVSPPDVGSVEPDTGDSGDTVPVTVRGEGFQPGARVEVDGDAHGITVTSGYRSEQEMSASFVIADDAPTGRPVDVIVINPDGKQGRKTGAFTVHGQGSIVTAR